MVGGGSYIGAGSQNPPQFLSDFQHEGSDLGASFSIEKEREFQRKMVKSFSLSGIFPKRKVSSFKDSKLTVTKKYI